MWFRCSQGRRAWATKTKRAWRTQQLAGTVYFQWQGRKSLFLSTRRTPPSPSQRQQQQDTSRKHAKSRSWKRLNWRRRCHLVSPAYAVIAVGQFPSGGWSNPHLVPVQYVQAPPDGIYDVDMVATRPTGVATMMLQYLVATQVLHFPSNAKGLRVGDKVKMF